MPRRSNALPHIHLHRRYRRRAGRRRRVRAAQQDTGGGRGVPAGGQAAVSGTVTDATSGAPIRADTPSSFGELAMYRPGDLYRMEVVGGGRAILAYTTFFAENIARTGYVPPAIDTQLSMYCSNGPTLN